MGIKERKERQKEELRQKIMNAATEILNKDGIDAVSIRNVAARIEYSPRTIYLYFKDKDELLQEIIESGFAVTVNNIEKIAESDLLPEEKIKLFLHANIEMSQSNTNYYSAVVTLIHKKGYKPRQNQQKVAQFLESELKNFYDAKNIKGKDIQLIIILIASFLRGFNMELINLGKKITTEKKEIMVESCVNSIMKGVMQL